MYIVPSERRRFLFYRNSYANVTAARRAARTRPRTAVLEYPRPMQTAAARYSVRPMHLDDIAQVMEVERQSFPSTWPQTAFKRELQQNRLARYLVVLEQPDLGAAAAGDET